MFIFVHHITDSTVVTVTITIGLYSLKKLITVQYDSHVVHPLFKIYRNALIVSMRRIISMLLLFFSFVNVAILPRIPTFLLHLRDNRFEHLVVVVDIEFMLLS